MPNNKQTNENKKSTNPLVFVGIGCLVLLVVVGVGISFALKFFAKNIGTSLVEKAIESKTGVKTQLSDLEKGKMTLTDEKTGTTIDIGSSTIPSSFPKDFPLYPGMKLLSSMAGSGKTSDSGYWLTFSTPDSFDTVSAYYKSELTKKGWKEQGTFTSGSSLTTAVSNAKYSGSLSITRESDSKETNVIIMLGEEAVGSPATETPSEE